MKKSYSQAMVSVLLIIGVLVILTPMISAGITKDLSSVQGTMGKVALTDSVKGKVKDITLVSNTEYCGQAYTTTCSALLKVELFEEGLLLDSIRFDKFNKVSKGWTSSTLSGTKVLINEPTHNGTANWINYDYSSKPTGTYYIKLEGTIEPQEVYDWIGTWEGVEVKEWEVWNGTRTAGLLEWYSFNNTYADVNGTRNLSVGGSVPYGYGKFGNATRWTGNAANFLYNFSATAIPSQTNGTFEAWVNLNETTTTKAVIYSASATGNNGNRFQIEGQNLVLGVNNAGNGVEFVYYNGGFTANTWYHVAGTWNNTKMFLYINGVLVNSSAKTSSTYAGTPSGIAIGLGCTDLPTCAASVFPFNGSIDEVKIFNYLRTQAEIVSDMGGMGITLVSPANNANVVPPTTFTSSSSYGTGLLNTTYYLWNSTGILKQTLTQTITGTTNTTSVSLGAGQSSGNYSWNVYSCGTDNTCAWATTNNTIQFLSLLENSQTYSNPVISTTLQNFLLNISYDSVYYSSISANLVYNGTTYASATKIGTGNNILFNSSINVPSVTVDVNYTFYWKISLSDGSTQTFVNSTTQTQQVNSVKIDDCSVYAFLLYNITMYDEDTLNKINGTSSNSTINVGINLSSGSSLYQNFSKQNPIQICSKTSLIGNNLIARTTIQYSATDYVTRFYNSYDNLNSAFNPNVSLYDLTILRSQEFLIILQDQNFLPISGAIIQIQRRYLSDGIWRIVDAPMTDQYGQTIAHMVLSSEVYNILAYKNGVLLGALTNQQAICQDVSTGKCTITFTLSNPSTPIFNVAAVQGVYYNFSLNQNTRTLSVNYQTVNGLPKTMGLNVTKLDAYNNETICALTQTASLGTFTCVIPASYGEVDFIADLYANGVYVGTYHDSIKTKAYNLLPGGFGIFLTIILLLTIVFMFGDDPIMKLVAMGVGVIIAGLLMFIENGSLISIGSSLMWLMVSIAIGIFYLSRRANK